MFQSASKLKSSSPWEKASNLKLIIFFSLLTFLLTGLIVITWEKVLLPPFYSWMAVRYPGDENRRWKFQQRAEHFFISMTVDLIVVTTLLWLVAHKQRKLIESETRYRALFEHAYDGIGIVTTADHHLIDVNDKFCSIFGLPATELLNRDIHELLPVADDHVAKSNSQALPRLLDGAAKGEQELTIHTAQNIALPVSVSFNWLVTVKESLIILIVRDLSVRKRLEAEKEEIQQQLFQTSKLASIGELSAGLAHEINNPLNGIINYAQLLKDAETEHSSLEQQALNGILDEGHRIAKIVRDLLTFARHNAHEINFVRIAEIIQSSIQLFGQKLNKEGIQVEIDLPEDLPEVKADGAQLRQVVVNMISNARHALKAKATEHSISKLLRVTACSVRQADKPEVVRLEFYDNGVGIQPENLPKVFDPFFTTRRSTGGTGLGLSISFGIVRDHGGTISVESEAGSFTRFIVELPTAESVAARSLEAEDV